MNEITKKNDYFSFYHFSKQYILCLSNCAEFNFLFWSSVTAAAFK